MIIIKVTKILGLTLPLEETIFKKPRGKGEGKIDPPPASRFRVKVACAVNKKLFFSGLILLL